jgi:LysR family transcriptional regulator for bpeEF and oprC
MTIHKLRALEYLIAVVDAGGVAPAARKLGVAAPSIHRLIRALEAEVGLTLLDRDARPLAPTLDGRHYVERAGELLIGLRQLESGLRDRVQSPSGVLVVAAQSVAIEHVLVPMLPSFHERFPLVQVDLRDAGQQRDVEALGADVLVMFGWPPSQPALMRTLAHTRWLVVAAPTFWARHGVPAHPSELARLPCALFRVPYGEVLSRWVFVRGNDRVEVETSGWLTGDHRNALDAPVLAGQMMARVNDLTARMALRTGSLQPVLLDWVGEASPPLTLLMRRALARQARVRAWVDFIASWAEGIARDRLPYGLPLVPPAQRPDWFRKRVSRV